eukprot:TRINITY_DN2949_c0_g1_i3.p1 TRINITY_DN2949_c0_g1~~TRINITY_DN2949_c0_g1_i3.p1  ORF type:complete len:174 (-),score=45.40 TRINITY_DN2949_c0_g1_i3:418-939(-)
MRQPFPAALQQCHFLPRLSRTVEELHAPHASTHSNDSFGDLTISQTVYWPAARALCGVDVADVPLLSPSGACAAGSAAEKAGLRGTARTRSGYIELGDIITMIDGDKISNEVDLFKALEDRKPGDVITITVTRTNMEDESTQEVKLRVTLQQSATPTAMSPLAPVSPPMLVPQ